MLKRAPWRRFASRNKRLVNNPGQDVASVQPHLPPLITSAHQIQIDLNELEYRLTRAYIVQITTIVP